jgi:hypothetical protein
MKKLIITKILFLIALLFAISLLSSCSTPEQTEVNPEKHTAIITIKGGSPQCWVNGANGEIKWTQSQITCQVQKEDVITAMGLSYDIDNSNNYGAADVHVTAHCSIKIDGQEVTNGVNWCAYQIP